MQYLYWRVSTGLNDKVEISFLLVGHTKFSPNWCFGLLKQNFRKTKVGCLADIAKVVNDSAVVNHAELVGTEDGTALVPQYDWAEYFTPFFKKTAFKGIKDLHHLVFSQATPGCVMVREFSDSTEKKVKVLASDHQDWSPSSSDMPAIITPTGLSQERRAYPFSKIRDCPPYCRDIVCPEPAIIDSASPPPPSPPPTPPRSPTPPPQPPRKRRRKK